MDQPSQELKETDIGSVRTLLKNLESLSRDSDHEFYFRGHSNKDYKLTPSIYRNPGWIKNEHKMFRELILRCPDEFHELGTTFQKLVKMQHYKLPTRLLDLTANPLIALLFACQDNTVKGNKDKEISTDGEVIIFRIPKDKIKYFDSDTVSVISNISKQPFDFKFEKTKENETPEEFSSQNSIKSLVHDICHEKSFFKPRINPEHLKSVICVKPMLDNPRILRQDGAFFLFGVDGEKKECSRIPAEYIHKTELRLIIKHKGKEAIRKQLEALGINEGRIYPEIDFVASYVKDSFEIKDSKAS